MKRYLYVFNIRVGTIIFRKTADKSIRKDYPYEAVLCVGKKHRIVYRNTTREELLNDIKANAGWTCEII